jgi:hypothetical protein
MSWKTAWRSVREKRSLELRVALALADLIDETPETASALRS